MNDPGSGPPLRIFVLGGFRVERSAHVIGSGEWGRRGAARTLVKILAVQRPHHILRDEVLDMLWRDVDPESALGRFAKALHAARRALEPELQAWTESSYLHLIGNILSLDSARVWIDSDAFEELAGRALQSGDLADLRAARAAYGGELLPEDRYEDWSMLARETLAGLHERVLLAIADQAHAARRDDEAESIWQEVVASNPLREDIHRALMQLYADRGNRAQALRQFELCREALEREIGVEPEPETVALRDRIMSRAAPVERPSAPSEGVSAPVVRIAGATRLVSRPATPPALPAAIRRPPAIPTVGRARVFALLVDDLDAAAGGHGQAVLIHGEPGIGKTRLLGDLARAAHERSVAVLWGGSGVQEHRVPYGPFIEALQSRLVQLSAEEQEALAEKHPQLAFLIPALRSRSEGTPPDVDAELLRSVVAAEFAAILTDVSAAGPILLAVDDLYAADAASLHLFHSLVRSAGDHAWLLAGSYRDDEIRPSGGSVFGRAFWRRDAGREIALGRLSRDDIGLLAGHILAEGALDSHLIDRFYSLTLGNPLYAEELARTMRRDGSLELVEGQWVLSPLATSTLRGRMADVVAGRIGELGPEVERLLNLAAVQGREFAFRRLLIAAEIAYPASYDAESILDLLDRALRAGILEDRGDQYAFTQPLMQATLVQHLSSHRRSRLHGATAQAIERLRPDDIEALAYHYGESDTPAQAIPYLWQAAARAERLYSNAEAIGHYQELIGRLESLSRAHEAAEAHLMLGYILTRVARYEDALAALERASDLFLAGGDIGGVARAMALTVSARFQQGTSTGGPERVERWRAEYGPLLPPVPAAGLHAAVAALYWQHGRYDDALREAEASLALIPPDDTAALSHHIRNSAETWRGTALIALDRIAEGRQVLERVLPEAEIRGFLLNVIRAANTLAALYQEHGDIRAQEPYLDRALLAAERFGDPVRLEYMLFRRGWHRWMMGRWNEARADFEQAASLDRETGTTWVSPYVSLGLGTLARAEGRYGEARDHLARARAVADQLGGTRAQWAAACTLAELHLVDGETGSAEEALVSVADAPGLTDGDRAWFDSLQAQVRLARGDKAGALELAHEAVGRAAGSGYRPALVEVLVAAGRIEAAAGNLAAAQQDADEAVRLAREIGDPYVEARAQHLRGRVLAQAHGIEPAREAVRQAQALFHRLGAQRDELEAGESLQALDLDQETT